MKKLIVVGSGAIGAMAVSALLGGGIASADGAYGGETYADASSAAGDAGQTLVVASRVGSTLSQDDCLVTRSQLAPFSSANDGVHVSSTVQVYLNCAGAVASATTSGMSSASPEGRAAKQAALQAAQDNQDQQDILDSTGNAPGAIGPQTIPEG